MEIVGWSFFWLALVYIMASFRLFKPNEVAVGYLLNKPWKVKGPGGWGFFPPFISRVHIYPTGMIRITSPTDKEKISRRDENQLKGDEMRPIRIIHATAPKASFWVKMTPENQQNPEWTLLTYEQYKKHQGVDGETKIEDDELQSSLTTEVIAFADFTIGKIHEGEGNPYKGEYVWESLFDFVKNIGSVEEMQNRIIGQTKMILQDLLGGITARNAVDAKSKIESLYKEQLELLVGEKPSPGKQVAERPWGVNIAAVGIEEYELGERVNKARADRAASIAARKESIEDARAEAENIKLKGKADAEAITVKGEAEGNVDKYKLERRAEGVARLRKESNKKGGEFTIAAALTEEALKEANVVITDSSTGALAGSAAAIIKGTLDSFQGLKRKPEPKPTQPAGGEEAA